MDTPEASVEFPPGDPAREYTLEQSRRVFAQLDVELRRLAARAFVDRRIDLGLLVEWHRNVFNGVKDHAGVHRREGRGTPSLIIFGKRALRDLVEEKLNEMFSKLHRGLQGLVSNPSDPAYEESAFHWAVWAHVQIVAIQPFEDGNKRTARLLLCHVLVTLGFDLLTFDHCRSEYFTALERAVRFGEIGLLRDLTIRTYVDSM